MRKSINYCLALVALLILNLIGCSDKKEVVTTQWYKGNLHTHSYWSDGDEFPEVILDWYKSNNYNFVALTEHNIIAEGDKWITIREDSIYQNAFNRYLNTYGENWVNYLKDSTQIKVKLKTLEQYRRRFEEPGKFLVIQSEEITDSYKNKPIHMNATNVQELIVPQGGNSVIEVLQNNIDAVINQRKLTKTPIIPHINHPNFDYALSLDDMVALNGERFFEVYNGHPAVHNMGDSEHMSTEEMWDLINIAYLESNKPHMYGLATDDSHHYHKKGSEWSNAGRGWVMVKAESLDISSLIEAMEAGEFYATTGVELKDVIFNDNNLSIQVKNEPNVSYKIAFIGCKKGQTSPEEFKVINGAKADFKLTKDILFVRCKITSSKLHSNPVESMFYESAWTQPIINNNN